MTDPSYQAWIWVELHPALVAYEGCCRCYYFGGVRMRTDVGGGQKHCPPKGRKAGEICVRRRTSEVLRKRMSKKWPYYYCWHLKRGVWGAGLDSDFLV